MKTRNFYFTHQYYILLSLQAVNRAFSIVNSQRGESLSVRQVLRHCAERDVSSASLWWDSLNKAFWTGKLRLREGLAGHFLAMSPDRILLWYNHSEPRPWSIKPQANGQTWAFLGLLLGPRARDVVGWTERVALQGSFFAGLPFGTELTESTTVMTFLRCVTSSSVWSPRCKQEKLRRFVQETEV